VTIPPEIQTQNPDADDDSRGDEGIQWNIRINQQFQIMQNEGFVIRGHTAALLQQTFQQSQRAGKVRRFYKNSINEAADMQPAPSREKPAKDHPQYEEKVNDQNEASQEQVEIHLKL